jgi:hypothetical protein
MDPLGAHRHAFHPPEPFGQRRAWRGWGMIRPYRSRPSRGRKRVRRLAFADIAHEPSRRSNHLFQTALGRG